MCNRPVFFFAILLIVMLPVGSVGADQYMDSAKIEFINDTQALLFNDRFEEADSAYSQFISMYSQDPIGYLYRAAGLFSRMSDLEEELHSEQFHTLLDNAEMLSGSVLDTCAPSTAAWMYLIRGHAKAYRSLWESRFGSTIKALKLGLSVDNEYETGLEQDSNLYDLYAGLGSFHYWKSAKAGMLSWVGIIKNEKDKGIAELNLAADSSLVHRGAARTALIWIYFDRKEYDSTIAIASEFAAIYPGGKVFLWPLAQAQYLTADYGSALDTYSKIRRKLAVSPGNYYNLVECDFHVCQCLNWLGEHGQASKSASLVNEYRELIPQVTFKRQRSKLNYLQRVAER
ncbi:MAG: hypothetical protein DRP45_04530 [Candidatus Zixiibacteriota bacterium]|nr:MAG: hypothetical protein DRP45_04530 [candidate division Zixibacteria bacterium]